MLTTVFFKKKSCLISALFSDLKLSKNNKINDVKTLKKIKKV